MRVAGPIEPSARLRGTWFVVPTPFHDDGALDLDSQRQLIEGARDWAVDGLAAMGVMSEASALSDTERQDALRTIFGAAGELPVVVGCSATSSQRAAQLACEARSLGAIAALVAAPPLLRNADSLPSFYDHVRTTSGLPIIAQDEPAATGTLLPVSVLLRAMERCGSLTVKLEDPPTPPKIAALLTARPDISVFGGLGGVNALSEMRRGACGTMTGFSYPEVLRKLRLLVATGDLDTAGRLFDRFLPLIAFEGQQGIGLGIRKEVLRRRQAIQAAFTRVGAPIDDATMLELDDVICRLGLSPSMAALTV